jgi:CRP-like cAMP-binding protein
VAVATFGTLMRALHLQAYLALAIVFGSIVAHLIGRPFDSDRESAQLLHRMEFAALAICWVTFWGGLIFYLGHEQPRMVPQIFKYVVSVGIVIANVTFFVYALYAFFREFIRDCKNKQKRPKKKKKSSTPATARPPLGATDGHCEAVINVGPTQVAPSSNPPSRAPSAEGKIDELGVGPTRSETRRSRTSAASRSRINASFQARINARHSMHIEKLQQSFVQSELQLKKKHAKQQEMARRHTMQRVKARAALIKSKRLKRVEIFHGLSDTAIGKLVDSMKGKTFSPGETLVRQGDTTAEFFIISAGTCNVHVDDRLVNLLSTHDHFGESAVTVAARVASSEEGVAGAALIERRNASVVASPQGDDVQVLYLDLLALVKLFKDGTLDARSIVSSIESAHQKRLSVTAATLAQRAEAVPNSRSLFS